MRRARSLLLAALVGALTLLPATPALAHPLGTFTVNTADRVEVVASGVRVLHVVDLAEIPTVQLAQPSAGVDTDGDGALSGPELDAHAARECARVAPDLTLVVDGAEAPLRLEGSRGESRPGQAPLTTVRLECRFASSSRPTASVALDDAAAARRNGWSEVTLASTCGRLEDSTAPGDSPSGLLTSYPEDLLSSPLRVTSGSSSVRPGGACTDGTDAGAADGGVLARGTDRLSRAFTDLVARPSLSVGFALVAVLLSVAFGAVHALAPGHGKTVVAAYLVGQRGTRRQAVWLGAAVTVAHTGSVLVLGALIATASLAAPERVVPYAEVVSGVLLALVGGWLLLAAVRRRRADPQHTHDHDQDHDDDHDDGDPHDHPHPHDHAHPHDDDHPHDHAPAPSLVTAPGSLRVAPARERLVHSHGGRAHSHAPLEDGPLGWRSLVTMGVAGGLVPSPSALIVLLGADALGRPWFGVLLVLCYGLGMAVTLTAAGLLLLRAQSVLVRRGWSLGQGSRVARVLPALTAAVVVVVGALLVARGLLSARDLG